MKAGEGFLRTARVNVLTRVTCEGCVAYEGMRGEGAM